MDVKLIFFKPDGTRRDVPLPPGDYTIGRGARASLRLALASISREHCQLSHAGDALRIQDLGSLNGTFRNDEKVAGDEPVEAGDVIRIGDCRITVQINGVPDPVEPPLPAADLSSMMDTPAPAASPSRAEDNATQLPGGSLTEGSSEFDFDFDFPDDDDKPS